MLSRGGSAEPKNLEVISLESAPHGDVAGSLSVQKTRGSDRSLSSHTEKVTVAKSEQELRVDRGNEKRKQGFIKRGKWILEQLRHHEVSQRIFGLGKILNVFEKVPHATEDESLRELQVAAVHAIFELVAVEELSRVLALAMRALVVLFPTLESLRVNDSLSEPSDVSSQYSQPSATGKPVSERKARRDALEAERTRRAESPVLTTQVLAEALTSALSFIDRDREWYLRASALQMIDKVAPLTTKKRKMDPNLDSCLTAVVNLLEKEKDERLRITMAQTLILLFPLSTNQAKKNEVVRRLADVMSTDTSTTVQILIIRAVAPYVNTDRFNADAHHVLQPQCLIDLVDSSNLNVRKETIHALRKIVPTDDLTIINTILERLKIEKSPRTSGRAADGREATIDALSVLCSPGNKTVIRNLIYALADNNHFVRAAAAKAMGKLADDDPGVVSKILQIIGEGDVMKSWSAIEALALTVQSKGRMRVQLLKEAPRLFASENPAVRRGAADALIHSSQAGAADVIRVMKPLFKSTFWGTREQAVWVVGDVGGDIARSQIPQLIALLDDPSWLVRSSTVGVLQALIDGQDEKTVGAVAKHMAGAKQGSAGREAAQDVLVLVSGKGSEEHALVARLVGGGSEWEAAVAAGQEREAWLAEELSRRRQAGGRDEWERVKSEGLLVVEEAQAEEDAGIGSGQLAEEENVRRLLLDETDPGHARVEMDASGSAPPTDRSHLLSARSTQIGNTPRPLGD